MNAPAIEVIHNGDAPVPEPDAFDEPSFGDPRDASSPAGAAADPEPEAAIIIPVEVVEAVVVAGFDAIAERRGEHWKVSDDEAHNIAEPLAGELEELARVVPFLGDAADALGGRRVRLLGAVIFTVTPRLVTDAMTPREPSRAPGPSTTTSTTAPRPADNVTPIRSGDELRFVEARDEADTLAAGLHGLPPRDGGA